VLTFSPEPSRVCNRGRVDLELVIFDGGSTGETLALLDGLTDDRVVVAHRGNGGLSAPSTELSPGSLASHQTRTRKVHGAGFLRRAGEQVP
jgi:hypothetical protein